MEDGEETSTTTNRFEDNTSVENTVIEEEGDIEEDKESKIESKSKSLKKRKDMKEEFAAWNYLSVFDEFGNEEIFFIDGDALFYKSFFEVFNNITETQTHKVQKEVNSDMVFVPSVSVIYQMEIFLKKLLSIDSKFILFFSDSNLSLLAEIISYESDKTLYLYLLIARQHFQRMNYKNPNGTNKFNFKSYFVHEKWNENINNELSIEKILDEATAPSDYNCSWSQLINFYNPSFIFTDMNVLFSKPGAPIPQNASETFKTIYNIIDRINIVMKAFTYFCLFNKFEVFLLENSEIQGTKLMAIGYTEEIKGMTQDHINETLTPLLDNFPNFPLLPKSFTNQYTIPESLQSLSLPDIRTILHLHALQAFAGFTQVAYGELHMIVLLVGIELIRTRNINSRCFVRIPEEAQSCGLLHSFRSTYFGFLIELSKLLSPETSILFGENDGDLPSTNNFVDLVDGKLFFTIFITIVSKGWEDFFTELPESFKDRLSTYLNVLPDNFFLSEYLIDLSEVAEEELARFKGIYQSMENSKHLFASPEKPNIASLPRIPYPLSSVFLSAPNYPFLPPDDDGKNVIIKGHLRSPYPDHFFQVEMNSVPDASNLLEKKVKKLNKWELKKYQKQSLSQRDYLNSLLAGTTLSKILIFDSKNPPSSSSPSLSNSSQDLSDLSASTGSEEDNLSLSGSGELNGVNNSNNTKSAKGKKGADYLEKIKNQKHQGKKGKVSNKKDLIIQKNNQSKEKKLSDEMTIQVNKSSTLLELLPLAEKVKLQPSLKKFGVTINEKILSIYIKLYTTRPSYESFADLFIYTRNILNEFSIQHMEKSMVVDILNNFLFQDFQAALLHAFPVIKTFFLKPCIPKNAIKLGADKFDYKDMFSSSLLYQLKYIAPELKREEGVPDKRVQFKPDDWQKELLDIVDRNESVIVEAPTSSGKTFISYYAMKKVLENDSKGVLIYVAPSKALAYQVLSEVEARFEKKYPYPHQHMLGLLISPLKLSFNIFSSQILITTPAELELLFLSPSSLNLIPNIQYIIFDEIHCINLAEGKFWESSILLNHAPIIALSATIGNSEYFINWLREKETSKNRKLHFIKHSDRYNDLSLHIYNEGKLHDFSPLFSVDPKVLVSLHDSSVSGNDDNNSNNDDYVRIIPEFSLQLYNITATTLLDPAFKTSFNPTSYYPQLVSSLQNNNNNAAANQSSAVADQSSTIDDQNDQNDDNDEEDTPKAKGNKKNNKNAGGRGGGRNNRTEKVDERNMKKAKTNNKNKSKQQHQQPQSASSASSSSGDNKAIRCTQKEIYWNLSMKQEKTYSVDLQRSLGKIGKESPETLKKIFSTYNASITSSMINCEKDLKEQSEMTYLLNHIYPMCQYLKDTKDLPVLFFHYSKFGCEKLMFHLVEQLIKDEFEKKQKEKIEERLLALEVSLASLIEKIERFEKTQKNDPTPGTPQWEWYESRTSVEAQIQLLKAISASFSFPVPNSTLPTREDIYEDKEKREFGVPKLFIKALKRGIGVHHNSLPHFYRRKVEQLFRMKKLGIVIATASLAFGINMPCKTVVFAGTARYFSSTLYRQMSGRAGRRGFDHRGKVIFFGVPPSKIVRLIRSKLPDINGNSLLSSIFVTQLISQLDRYHQAGHSLSPFLQSIERILSPPLFQSLSPFSSSPYFLHFIFQLQLSILQQMHILNDQLHPTVAANFLLSLQPQPVNYSHFAFLHLVQSNVFEAFLESLPIASRKRELMAVLSSLFSPFPLTFDSVHVFQLKKKNSSSLSQLYHDELPEPISTFIRDFENMTLKSITQFLQLLVSTYPPNAPTLPLSTFDNPEIETAPDSIPSLTAITTQTSIVSPFFSLADQTDQFSSINQLLLTQRADLPLQREYLPLFSKLFKYSNSALFDFWNHSQLDVILSDNRISLRDFVLPFKTFLFQLEKISVFLPPSTILASTFKDLYEELVTLYYTM